MSLSHAFRRSAAAAVVTLALAPAAALGGAPLVFHDRDFVELSGVNVCGITVDLVSEAVFTDKVFLDEEGNFVRVLSSGSGSTTFTAANGNSVVVRFSNLFIESAPVVDEAAGTITFTVSLRGLPELIKTPQGAVLVRDAGVITFVDTFDLDTGDPISSELVIKGPHPEADSDFTLFCEVVSDALT